MIYLISIQANNLHISTPLNFNPIYWLSSERQSEVINKILQYRQQQHYSEIYSRKQHLLTKLSSIKKMSNGEIKY